MVVRIEKLLKVDGYKAKAALLTALGSVIGSEDWSVRKAAAEALEKLAVVERDLLLEFKSEGLKTSEAKKFDKVKVVRDQMIEAWKAIRDVPEEEGLTPTESHSLSKAKVASDEIQVQIPIVILV
ncbi:putative MT-associated protein TORTIFOLIA1/SPIRAL2 [Helianthus annuus]|nr:putative MT-associated protein TORTIFOLIA1/SPIRAL2 [Helianthus annuus]KAJ0634026.1 putative MT-associated protein TORTIFOLIA1/SPIRAL2 [Helianthus annuus]